MFESWRLTKPLDIHPAGDDYEVVESGVYRDFAGELHFRITPQGSIRVSYDFTYSGTDVRAREVGLQFGVPLWCDKLQWRRQGEWTVYPEEHIGRNVGIAMAHAPGSAARAAHTAVRTRRHSAWDQRLSQQQAKLRVCDAN